MSVEQISIEFPLVRLPRHVEILLHETSESLEKWEGSPDQHSFVPADYVLVYDALCALRSHMPSSPRFLEWGSGLGIVTLLASALGWKAEGVEIKSEFVQESRYFSKQFDLPIRIHHGSFFPEEAGVIERLADICIKSDLIYVYPWPDQEIEIFDLFDRLSRPGAFLLTYYGLEDVRVFRKHP